MKTVTVGIKSQLICKFDFFLKTAGRNMPGKYIDRGEEKPKYKLKR
jgi:hypothetical protein